MVVPFRKFDGKIWVITGKRFSLEVSFHREQKECKFFLKTALGIFKLVLRLRDRPVFV